MLRRSTCGLLLLVAGFVGTAPFACAQDYSPAARLVVPSESIQVRNRLRAIDRLLEPAVSVRAASACLGRLALPLSGLQGPSAASLLSADRPNALWQRAEEAYADLLGDAGEALVPLPAPAEALGTTQTALQVRRLCQLRLASLPRSVLAGYRRRVDGEARQLLARARQLHDAAPLRQLVDELFCSSSTPEALDLLGDLAFERGDFDEARAWWRCLAPLPPVSQSVDELFPFCWPGASSVDSVRLEAKQILALAFEGALTTAQEELARFHHRHPDARGSLAGTEGCYSEIVHAALQRVVRAGLANQRDPWSTYGGAAQRNHVLTVCPPAKLWEDGPAWRVRLPALEMPRPGKEKTSPAERVSAPRRPVIHPIVVDKQVLVADGVSVSSFHLTTGKRLFRYDLRSAGLTAPQGPDRAAAPPHSTLTAADGLVYARLGRAALAPRRTGAAEDPSYLVCLDLTAAAEAVQPREKWVVESKPGEFFEGAPLVRHGRAYVALSRLVGKRVVTALQCFDAFGRLRWSCDVCDAPEFEDSVTPRQRHHLVTWAGNQLVYCTHTGVVAAVEPWQGKLLWVVRYASRGPWRSDGSPSSSAAGPCVYDNGRVYVAPADSERLYCLEACTGRALWERDDLEMVDVLGAVQGRLLVTTRQGVHALDTATGLTLWQQPGEGRLGSFGRGLLAGSWLLWPTQDGKLPVRAVTLAAGGQQKGDEDNPFAEPRCFDPTQFRRLPPGNLAFGQDCLAVADTEELSVFVPSERQPLLPADAAPRLHLQVRRPAPATRAGF